MNNINEAFLINIGWSKEGAKFILDRKYAHSILLMLNRIARKNELQQFPIKRQVKKKKIIPSDIRWNIWERDNFTCLTCGERKYLTIDHIIPESKGGTLSEDNLQTLCKSCNSRKGNR